MAVIENFAVLPAKEQREFAEALVKTINSENIFSSETKFEITEVNADEITGNLMIEVSHPNPIEVWRSASWTAADSEDAHSTPDDVDYDRSAFDDVKKAFKTLSTVIDDYKVSLEIDDLDYDETIDVDVEDISHEDDGIGSYEFWGDEGYDSDEYVVATGAVLDTYYCSITLWVEPNDEPAAEPEEN